MSNGLYLKDRLHAEMDSDSENHLAPDELYLILQANMINIKKQEQALTSEIREIAAKFKSLLEICGLEAEFPVCMSPPPPPSFMQNSLTYETEFPVSMAPPPTPSFMQNSLTYVTACTTTPSFMNSSPECILSSSSSDESLFPTNPVCSLAESEDASTDGLFLEETKSKTLVLDNNSNYLNSSRSDTDKNMDHTPTIEVLHNIESTDNSHSSSLSSTSIWSSVLDSTSDGYPKSEESSDNQVVPECYDLDKEFMSRLQYYSDFTIDRQRKINSMVSQLSKSNHDSHSGAFAEELFTRHVEGAESSHLPIRVPFKIYSSSSGGSSNSFSKQRSRRGKKLMRDRTSSRSRRKRTSIPIASSTMLDDSFMSGSSGRSSQRSSSSSNPIASSTLLDDAAFFPSSSKTKSNMATPKASSTMIDETILSKASSLPRPNNIARSTMISDLSSEMPSRIGPSDEGSIHSLEDNEDLESIYTWSIYDDLESSDVNIGESYMRNIMKKWAAAATDKPPLPPPRRRASSTGNADICENYKDGKCKDPNLHKILGESCSRHGFEAISAIEPHSTLQEGNLIVESLYEDEGHHFPCKPNVIPRSSTKIRLQDKSSGSSSMEAKRASNPDLYSVSTPNNDYRSTVQTSNSNSTDSSPLQERLELVGKSSSSNEKDSSSNVPPPPSVTISSPTTESPKDALVDSILTDSPNSVSSSGIFAPCNSPARNFSSSSKISSSTTSGKNSADSNNGSKAVAATSVTQPQPTVISEQPQRTEGAVAKPHAVFKIPRQRTPLKHLFKFRRHKCKTPASPKSEPNIFAPSVQSDPLSRCDHFPSLPSVRHEPRIVDKKAVIRKFKKFSETFYKRDKSGQVEIQTLANL